MGHHRLIYVLICAISLCFGFKTCEAFVGGGWASDRMYPQTPADFLPGPDQFAAPRLLAPFNSNISANIQNGIRLVGAPQNALAFLVNVAIAVICSIDRANFVLGRCKRFACLLVRGERTQLLSDDIPTSVLAPSK